MISTVSSIRAAFSAYFGENHMERHHPLSTTNALGQLGLFRLSGLPETFLVMNGDILTTLNYQKLIQFHRRRGGLVTIAMSRKKVPLELGVMEFDRAHQLTRYIEKPTLSYSVSMGIYIFEKKVLKWIRPGRYLDFPELIQKLLQRKEKVICYPSGDFWLDIGRHEDYEQAQKQFQKLRKKLLYEK
jgi:NDP-sugar pyrophosphorylase family protein